MTKLNEIKPTHVAINLDDLNILLDALDSHIIEIAGTSSYSYEEIQYSINQTRTLQDTLFVLYQAITGEGYPAIPRYQAVPTGTTEEQRQMAVAIANKWFDDMQEKVQP